MGLFVWLWVASLSFGDYMTKMAVLTLDKSIKNYNIIIKILNFRWNNSYLFIVSFDSTYYGA